MNRDERELAFFNREILPHVKTLEDRTAYVIEDPTERREAGLQIARGFDVPPWLCVPDYPRPRFARLRWVLRRWWEF